MLQISDQNQERGSVDKGYDLISVSKQLKTKLTQHDLNAIAV